MRGYELMKETLLRRRFILIMHFVILGIYGLLFLPDLSEAHWQPALIGFSGFLLPIFISAGIFGDDVASGRIAALVTKPVHAAQLYLWRAAGLAAQGILHFGIAITLIIVLHRVTGRRDLDEAAFVVVAGFLLFCTCATLSTTISVLVKREFNSAVLIIGAAILVATYAFLLNKYPNFWATQAYHQLLKYGCPPLELISNGLGKPLLSRLLIVLHAVGLTAAYAGLGIFFLSMRQFPQARD
jgi:ABC-type transport system involved in multi-copper enzyme maturation permease subunit